MRQTSNRAGLTSLVFGITIALSVVVIQAQLLLTDTTVMYFGALNKSAPPPGPTTFDYHIVSPEEVTITKGETVTFKIIGGGHGLGIYPVSKHTQRADILDDLCLDGPGPGPGGVCNAFHPLAHQVTDAKGDVVIDIPPASPGPPIFDVAPGRIFAAAGSNASPFLVGALDPASPTSDGLRFQYKFEKTGRYLVICINRVHSIRDHMFGFVEVVGGPK
jgi:plastocyanin